MDNPSQKPCFVLLHGAGLGAWIWDKVRNELDYPNLAVDFPKRSEPKESRSNLSLADYTDEVMEQIDRWDKSTGKVVIVAHSLGGVIGLALAEKLQKRLAGFCAVGATIPKSGKNFLSVLPLPKRVLMSAVLQLVGTQPPAKAIESGLCNDLDEELTNQVISKYSPESVAVYRDKVSYQFSGSQTLYIRLDKDVEFGKKLQTQMASNLPNPSIVELHTGHLPMLSKPSTLASILNDFGSSLD